MVHIEAFGTDPITRTANNYTFFGRYAGWQATGSREPLAPPSPPGS